MKVKYDSEERNLFVNALFMVTIPEHMKGHDNARAWRVFHAIRSQLMDDGAGIEFPEEIER